MSRWVEDAVRLCFRTRNRAADHQALPAMFVHPIKGSCGPKVPIHPSCRAPLNSPRMRPRATIAAGCCSSAPLRPPPARPARARRSTALLTAATGPWTTWPLPQRAQPVVAAAARQRRRPRRGRPSSSRRRQRSRCARLSSSSHSRPPHPRRRRGGWGLPSST